MLRQFDRANLKNVFYAINCHHNYNQLNYKSGDDFLDKMQSFRNLGIIPSRKYHSSKKNFGCTILL